MTLSWLNLFNYIILSQWTRQAFNSYCMCPPCYHQSMEVQFENDCKFKDYWDPETCRPVPLSSNYSSDEACSGGEAMVHIVQLKMHCSRLTFQSSNWSFSQITQFCLETLWLSVFSSAAFETWFISDEYLCFASASCLKSDELISLSVLLFKKELTGNYLGNPELPMLNFSFWRKFALHIMQYQLINFIFTKYSVQC